MKQTQIHLIITNTVLEIHTVLENMAKAKVFNMIENYSATPFLSICPVRYCLFAHSTLPTVLCKTEDAKSGNKLFFCLINQV